MSEGKPQLTIEDKGEYLLITFPPYKSVSQMQSCIEEILDAVDAHNSRKLLVDLRSTRKKVPIMELYELCIYVVSKFGPLQARIAGVASTDAIYQDRFGETVLRNRGVDFIRFVDNEQEALDWLLAPVSQTAPS